MNVVGLFGEVGLDDFGLGMVQERRADNDMVSIQTSLSLVSFLDKIQWHIQFLAKTATEAMEEQSTLQLVGGKIRGCCQIMTSTGIKHRTCKIGL